MYLVAKFLEYNIRGTGKDLTETTSEYYGVLCIFLSKTLFAESNCVTNLPYILVNPLNSIEKGS